MSYCLEQKDANTWDVQRCNYKRLSILQVEGCNRELSDLSAYHQKCRICDIHIKAPSFMRAGLKQRFCQRCGRCHELDAFEGSKRSCIAQLAKHNARCAAAVFPHHGNFS